MSVSSGERAPILITGAHRSGSTFVGRILSRPRCVGLITEPFSMLYGLDWVDRWYLHLYSGMPDEALRTQQIEAFLAGRARYKRAQRPPNGAPGWRDVARRILYSRHQIRYWATTRDPGIERYLIKDPLASLSSEFLHRRFGMKVVILVRHPAAFAASVKRAVSLRWRAFDFENFRTQPELMRSHLSPLLTGRDTESLSVVENASLQWACLYTVLSRFADRNPDMLVVRHEDLSSNPIGAFFDLFERLTLPWNARVEQEVVDMTNPDNPEGPVGDRIHSLRRDSRDNVHRWKTLLSADEVESVRRASGVVAARYYDSSDWS